MYKIIDLHNDWADNSLILSHKNFFVENWINEWRNYYWLNVNNQVDLPRLQKWNVKLVFGASCLMPNEINQDINIRRYLIKQQLDYYDYILKNSNWKIFAIKNKNDLDKVNLDENIWLIKHMEWFYFIDQESDLKILNYYYQRWVRSIALTWNFDNCLAWWAWWNWNLTKIWKKVIDYIENNNIILDLAHIWKKSFWEIANYTKLPLFISHTQVNCLIQNNRNIDDEQIKAIAKSWWLIWLMPHPKYLWSNKLDDFLKSIKYVYDLVWINYIAIWSDFDWTTSNDLINEFQQSSDFQILADKMIEYWFTVSEIEKILYTNAFEFIKKIL